MVHFLFVACWANAVVQTSVPQNEAELQLYRVMQRASLLGYYDTLLEMGMQKHLIIFAPFSTFISAPVYFFQNHKFILFINNEPIFRNVIVPNEETMNEYLFQPALLASTEQGRGQGPQGPHPP